LTGKQPPKKSAIITSLDGFDAILEERVVDGQQEYLVKWNTENTWVKDYEVEEAAIEEFKKSKLESEPKPKSTPEPKAPKAKSRPEPEPEPEPPGDETAKIVRVRIENDSIEYDIELGDIIMPSCSRDLVKRRFPWALINFLIAGISSGAP
jgi:hypothetical protein